MLQCHVCGSTGFRETAVDELFQIDGQPVLVENIAACVCVRCGEATFSRETTEQIRRMVASRGEAQPLKSVELKVFAFGRGGRYVDELHPSRNAPRCL